MSFKRSCTQQIHFNLAFLSESWFYIPFNCIVLWCLEEKSTQITSENAETGSDVVHHLLEGDSLASCLCWQKRKNKYILQARGLLYRCITWQPWGGHGGKRGNEQLDEHRLSMAFLIPGRRIYQIFMALVWITVWSHSSCSKWGMCRCEGDCKHDPVGKHKQVPKGRIKF